VTQEIAKLL